MTAKHQGIAPPPPPAKPNFPVPAIYCRDNLEVMANMATGVFDLIYLDPPFNTGNIFQAPIGTTAQGAKFSDIWKWDNDREQDLLRLKAAKHWLGQWVSDIVEHLHSSNMKAYLAFMGPRLIEMHRLLKPTGSLFLHCDQYADSYLQILLDGIFDKDNFVNQISWLKINQKTKKKFPQKNDTILFYHKNAPQGKFYPQFRPLNKDRLKAYRYKDEDGRLYAVFQGAKTRPWQKKEYRYYLDESEGSQIGAVWDDIKFGGASKERLGYPTQKPLKLLLRIIKATTEPGDLVLDPFCGCATTCVAAHQLNREWVGIDISPKAYELVKMRLEEQAAQGNLEHPLKEISFSTEPPSYQP